MGKLSVPSPGLGRQIPEHSGAAPIPATFVMGKNHTLPSLGQNFAFSLRVGGTGTQEFILWDTSVNPLDAIP